MLVEPCCMHTCVVCFLPFCFCHMAGDDEGSHSAEVVETAPGDARARFMCAFVCVCSVCLTLSLRSSPSRLSRSQHRGREGDARRTRWEKGPSCLLHRPAIVVTHRSCHTSAAARSPTTRLPSPGCPILVCSYMVCSLQCPPRQLEAGISRDHTQTTTPRVRLGRICRRSSKPRRLFEYSVSRSRHATVSRLE